MNEVKPFLLYKLNELEYLFKKQIEQKGKTDRCLALKRVGILKTLNRIEVGLGHLIKEKDIKNFF